MSIVVNKKVRELLEQLDKECAVYDQQTERLSTRGALSDSQAVAVGADRQLQQGIILGVAHQIRMYSSGRWKA